MAPAFDKWFHFVESVGGRGFFALEIPPLLELNQSGKTVLPDSRSSPNKSAASPRAASAARVLALTGKAPVDLIVFGSQPPAMGGTGDEVGRLLPARPKISAF